MESNYSPLVTVLVPVFNGAKYLNTCIDSILNQTYLNFELLIIDDYSTDNSIEIIKQYDSDKIILINNKENYGLTETLNIGLNIANGKFIARLDQDDISDRLRLQLQVDYFKNNPEIVLLGSFCEFIDQNNKVIGNWNSSLNHYDIINSFQHSNPFAHSSVMFDKEKVIDLGGYPIEYIYAQDLALWINICSKYKVANLDSALTKIRIHDKQATFDEKLLDVKIYEELNLTKNSLTIPGMKITTKIRLLLKLISIWIGIVKNKLLN